MKYVVDVQGERVDVVPDTLQDAHLADVEGTPVKLLTIGANVYRVVVQRGAGRGVYTLWIDGWRFAVEALDERQRAIRDLSVAAAGASGPAPLKAPMPGLIVRVLVDVGAEVSAGQPLVVMEAMKMENELRASAAGRVSAVRATAGDAVEKGAVLVELE